MKPRVLVLTTYYYPVLGGVETHARQLIRHLHERRLDVQVVTKRVDRAHPADEVIDGVAVHRTPPVGDRQGLGKWLAVPFFFASLIARRRSFDLLVCIDYRGIGVAAVAAGALLRRPVVVQAGTAGVLAPPDEGSGVPPENAAVGLLKLVPRAVYRHADHFVCISRDIEQETIAAGVARDRVHYLPHGVDLERFHPPAPGERDAVRAALGWPPDRAVVLFVGRLSVEKGVLDLLEAWRTLAPVNALLVLVGPDMPSHSWDAGERARAFVAAHGLLDQVRFQGPLADPAPAYRAADLFAQPSHFEAFGISAIEAMASGLPVVAASVGGLRDFLVDDGNALLHRPRDPTSIAAALAKALADPSRRTRVAAAALEDVKARFDERLLLSRYARIIEAAGEAAVDPAAEAR